MKTFGFRENRVNYRLLQLWGTRLFPAHNAVRFIGLQAGLSPPGRRQKSDSDNYKIKDHKLPVVHSHHLVHQSLFQNPQQGVKTRGQHEPTHKGNDWPKSDYRRK